MARRRWVYFCPVVEPSPPVSDIPSSPDSGTPVTSGGIGSGVSGEPSPVVEEGPMSEACHGEYSQWANAVRVGPTGGSAETSHLFPEGWSTPGDQETRTSTIRGNAEAGLWLPLFIPAGCDGHKGDVDPETGIPLPEVIYYAANHVASMFDQKFGPIDSSRDARYAYAVELANEASLNTSGGGPNVREVP